MYVAIGITLEGPRDVIGLWTSANEGGKSWMNALTEMTEPWNAGCVPVLGGRSEGFSQAIEAIYPKAQV